MDQNPEQGHNLHRAAICKAGHDYSAACVLYVYMYMLCFLYLMLMSCWRLFSMWSTVTFCCDTVHTLTELSSPYDS